MVQKPRSAEMHPGSGFRVKQDFARPDPALMAAFRHFPTPYISDHLNRLYAVDPAIKCLTSPHHQLVGPACTVKVFPGDNLMVHKSLDVARPGDVVVVDAGRSYMNAVLVAAYRKASDAGVAAMLTEMIPGPDDRLCSYFTYMDANGRPLFHFTKRVGRRFPVNMGDGSYHVTDRNPEVRDLSVRLFRAAGLRGLANAEFKRDHRDGRLKLIECNARFTASDCLVAASGIDLASFVYNRLVGLPLPPTDRYRVGLRLWNPGKDFKAYKELRRRKEFTPAGWLRSIRPPLIFQFFRWRDPMPTEAAALLALGADPVYAAGRSAMRAVAAWTRGWFTPRRPAESTAPPAHRAVS